jgi:hypothetical protein
MSTQHTLSRLGRIARRTTLAAIAGALAVALVPTQALAADDAVTITSPVDGDVLTMYADWTTPTVAEDALVVTFVATGSPVTCSLDGQAAVPCTSPVSFEQVAQGEHHVTVSAGSASGTNTFTVNTYSLGPPPVIDILEGPNFSPPATVKARWKVGAHRTWVRHLELRRMSRHVRVHVRCKGAGCPTPHRFTRRASGHLDLTPSFRGHGLRPGARIVIRISKSGATLWTFRYTIRGGARPRLVEN